MKTFLQRTTERLATLCDGRERRACPGLSAPTSSEPSDARRSEGVPTPTREPRPLRRFFIALIGGTVVLIGIAMIVLPGPAVVVIPAGLAILATEFIWARRALRRCKGATAKVRRKSGLAAWLRRRRQRPESKAVTATI